eukprot:symbB.v1.2.005108.t1/scaffold294.1/size237520/6
MAWSPMVSVRVFRFCQSAIWWTLVILYVIDPSRLMAELNLPAWLNFCFYCYYKAGLFEVSVGLPAAVCLILIPRSILTISSRKTNFGPHMIGIITLTACALEPFGGPPGLKEWIVYVGIVTGRAATAYLGILLLVISRSSILSDWHGLEYISMIPLHRIAGWWVVAFSLLHSLAFVVYYLMRGGWHDLLISCIPLAVPCDEGEYPCWNLEGLVNGFGVVATLTVILLGLFSRKYVRRSFYNHFYFTHVPSSFVFMMFCGLHDFSMALLMFPGLVLYFKDRVTARRSRIDVEVTSKVLCQDESTVILLSWPCEASRHLLPGSRWVYLSVPSISSNQWHPFSVIQHAGKAFVVLKNSGDWCQALCDELSELSESRSYVNRIKVDGPYGSPFGSQESPSKNGTLLLVAGGVGISPFVDLLINAGGPSPSGEGENSRSSIKVIWAVRSHEYYGIAAAIDLQLLSQKASVSVYITSEEREQKYVPVGQKSIGFVPDSESHTVDHWPTAVVFVSCALLAVGVVVSDLFHPLEVGESVRSITEWALIKRLLPLVICLLITMFVSFGMWVAKQQSPKRNRCYESWPERFIEDFNESNLQIFHSKPNLEELLQDVEGSLEVKACGPERMLASLSSITQRLKASRGFEVDLDILESNL